MNKLPPGRIIFPKNVQDSPLAVVFGHVHVVDPRRGADAHTGSATEDVEDPDRVSALGRRDSRASTHACALDEGHRAHLDETASSRGIAEDVALGKLGVKGSLHARAVGGVPPVNVVESGGANGRGVGGGLGMGKCGAE